MNTILNVIEAILLILSICALVRYIYLVEYTQSIYTIIEKRINKLRKEKLNYKFKVNKLKNKVYKFDWRKKQAFEKIEKLNNQIFNIDKQLYFYKVTLWG